MINWLKQKLTRRPAAEDRSGWRRLTVEQIDGQTINSLMGLARSEQCRVVCVEDTKAGTIDYFFVPAPDGESTYTLIADGRERLKMGIWNYGS